MSLSSQLKQAFSSGDRNRGDAYASEGAVFDMFIEDGLLNAKVSGSYGHYEVHIDLKNNDDDPFFCECPRFADGFNCKHLWAAILTYDQRSERIANRAKPTNGSASNGPVPTTTEDTKKPNAVKPTSPKPKSIKPALPAWQSLLSGSAEPAPASRDTNELEQLRQKAQKQQEIFYVVDVAAESMPQLQVLDLLILERVRKRNGEWSRLKRLPGLSITHNTFDDLVDVEIIDRLVTMFRHYTRYSDFPDPDTADFQLNVAANADVLDQLVSTKRFFWSLDEDHDPDLLHPIKSTDVLNPCSIKAEVVDIPSPKGAAELRFRIEQVKLDSKRKKRIKDADIVKLADDGSGLTKSSLIRIDNPEAIALWRNARDFPPIKIKKSDRKQFLKQLAATPGVPKVELPASWQVDDSSATPCGLLKLTEATWGTDFDGAIHFRYGETRFAHDDPRSSVFDEETNSWCQRDVAAEARLYDEVLQLPYVLPIHEDGDFRFQRPYLIQLVDTLSESGWEIILLGKKVKSSGDFDIQVESGVDWFDLSAEVDFEGQSIALPSLLAAMAKRESFVTLADGSHGRIPTALLERYAKLAQFGEVEGDAIRFRPAQAMLLDALLESKDGVEADKDFQIFCKKLKSFSGIKPKAPPKSFQGELRGYQKEGLGWLHFLREFRLGGCLADDMGLGKTIQVLGLLEARRTRRIVDAPEAIAPPKMKSLSKKKAKKKVAANSRKTKTSKSTAVADLPEKEASTWVASAKEAKRKPSIVVVPKSLVFNWIDEAAKFTPKLRFLNYTGTDRKKRASESAGFDVIITTYGTMRKDIADLAALEFDYAILDESQAIKNAKAQCAKASRLLRADNRLAMTGTPIENHLGELWSLFEFLNPGMLGASTKFNNLTRQKKSNEKDRQKTLEALSKAIQPFVLRRTKEQVLTDLPPKTEQTLFCDMLPAQKKKYDELKEYYRVKLAKKVGTKGLCDSKIQILEALLRLRQVACDPRLLDDKAKPGAKIDLLHQQLGEVVSEGHKILIFSQFTQLLALVRDQFDANGIRYEYLDGKTRDRKSCVKRFQDNPEVSAFLISLKAGGSGLNLTAADYVYVLDPWWNPAAEAQAVDRAHRIGQLRPVIAYRMICRDTVEEKIVELQESKRELANSIIRADESIIRTMTADDLTLLLS